MSEIIYLASYPKSGNTWFRTFISNLIIDSDTEFTINEIKTDGIYSSRPMFDNMAGIKASMLNHDEIDKLRPKVYEKIAQNLQRNLYIKVHDAYTYLKKDTPLLNTTNAKVIYILRNPLDVSVSFANHAKKTIENVIEDMNNSDFVFCGSDKSLANQLRQKLLTWSEHVESYTIAHELPICFLRYEDMKLDSFKTFKRAVDFIGLNVSDEEIEKAIELSSFNRLQQLEDAQGFREKPYNVKNFFRKGEVGDWRNHLSDDQMKRLIECHGDTMQKYGYLNDKGEPIY